MVSCGTHVLNYATSLWHFVLRWLIFARCWSHLQRHFLWRCHFSIFRECLVKPCGPDTWQPVLSFERIGFDVVDKWFQCFLASQCHGHPFRCANRIPRGSFFLFLIYVTRYRLFWICGCYLFSHFLSSLSCAVLSAYWISWWLVEYSSLNCSCCIWITCAVKQNSLVWVIQISARVNRILYILRPYCYQFYWFCGSMFTDICELCAGSAQA